MQWKRLDNEGEFHLIWRVYKHFDNGGTITDVDKAGEICNELLKVDYDESRHRKLYEGFMKVWREVRNEYISEESLLEQLDEIEDKKDELYKQQVKTRDKLREKRSTLRDEARIENLINTISEVAKNMPVFDKSKIDARTTGDKTGVLRISDWHVFKVIDNFWNKYNKDIAINRVLKLTKETIKYCRILGIDTLYVANLNDLIEGNIHISSRVNAEEDAIQQVMFASELVANMLDDFHQSGLNVKYVSVLDNHSRINKNYKEHIEKENFAKLIDWYLKARLENVEFISNNIDENLGHVVIDGKNHFFVHGHLKAHSLNSIIQNITLATGLKADYVHAGHWHSAQTKDFQFCKVFVNGSLCGVDEYAKNMGFFSDPSQSLIVIDENDMRIDIKL